MKLYTTNNITELLFNPSNPWHVQLQERIVPLILEGCEHYIPNVHAQMAILEHDNVQLPISINEHPRTSYVANPLNYIEYGHDEIDIEVPSGVLNSIMHGLVSTLWYPFKMAGFHKVVVVNNWLLSTNLYPLTITKTQIYNITQFLKAKYPGHTIMWRSLNETHHGHYMRYFKELQYMFVPSRQI